MRYGYKCSQCHFNPSGGGKRNSFGNIFSQTELPAHVLSLDDLTAWLASEAPATAESPGEAPAPAESPGEQTLLPRSIFYPGYLGRFLSLGGDFRFNNRTIIAGGSTANTLAVTEANVYGSLELLGDGLSFYIDETIAPGGAASREVYGLLRGPWGSYLKAGRMMLPYGLRLQDDSAFIREITGFNYGVQDLGVEVGCEPGPMSVSLAMSNGTQGSTDDNLDKQVSGVVSFVQRWWRLGAHGTWNNTAAAKRIGAGGFAGFQLGRFTLLGEADYLIDELESVVGEPIEHSYLLYGGITYLLARGVNLQVAYDFADPDTSASKDSFIRVSAGVEVFLTQFTQLRAFYRFRDDTEDSARDDESVVDLELHLFF